MTSAVIPARNEADRIAATLGALAAVEGVDEVIVVDDGSTDATADAAAMHGARVVVHARNLGKGAALETGVRSARGEILLLLDADLGDTAAQAALLLDPVRRGEADMAIAMFPVVPGRGGGMGLVVRLARWGIRRAAGREMAAPLSGQRALKREVWDRARHTDRGFGVETGLTIDALRAGFRVVEVPTTMTHRVTGRDVRGVVHRARQFRDVALALWARRGTRC